MNKRESYRNELHSDTDDALKLRYLRLLRVEASSGCEDWQTDECRFELARRGMEDAIEAARQVVEQEERARRSQGRRQ